MSEKIIYRTDAMRQRPRSRAHSSAQDAMVQISMKTYPVKMSFV